MDRRILDFSKSPTLPRSFKNVKECSIIYASGDGFGGFDKNGNYRAITNIEAFYKEGYNIFCCAEISDDNENIRYLKDNKDLNVVLCILTGDTKTDFRQLIKLFEGAIDVINTDDVRFYPDSKTCFKLLKVGGICKRVHKRFIVGQSKNTLIAAPFQSFNSGWAEPNFIIVEKGKRNEFTLMKVGEDFNRDTNIRQLRNIQEESNSSLADNLRMRNALAWTMKSKRGGRRYTSKRKRS